MENFMFYSYRNFIGLLLLTTTFFSFSSVAAAAQTTRPRDTVGLEKKIRFRRGAVSAVVNGQIKLGTTHRYHVNAREGQRIAVVLRTGNKTSFTIYGHQSGILDGADGVKQAVVELPESGDFTIEIGTDATANYKLEVAIK